MKSLGKTIQIYCPSGKSRGVRVAETTTRMVQAVVVLRAKFDEALGRPELGGVGLYFLLGQSESGGTPGRTAFDQNGMERRRHIVRELSQVLALAVPHAEALRVRDDVAYYDALEMSDSAVKVLGDETLRGIARDLIATVPIT